MSDKQLYVLGHCEKEPEWKYNDIQLQPPVSLPDYYKIGIANDPEQRVSNMSSATPHVLRLITTLESDDAKAVESKLHSIYSKSRQKGEWFNLTSNAVNSLTALDRLDRTDIPNGLTSQAQLFDSSLYVEVMGCRADE